MSEDGLNVKKTVIDGIEIIEDGDVTHFRVSDEQRKKDAEREESERRKRELEEEKSLPWYRKLFNWLKKHEATPYIKIGDMADPFDERGRDPFDDGVGSDGSTSIEAGIKISF